MSIDRFSFDTRAALRRSETTQRAHVPPIKLETGKPFTVAALMFPCVAQLNRTESLAVFGRVCAIRVSLVEKALDLVGVASIASPDLVEQVRRVMKPVSERQAAAIEIARARLGREAV